MSVSLTRVIGTITLRGLVSALLTRVIGTITLRGLASETLALRA